MKLLNYLILGLGVFTYLPIVVTANPVPREPIQIASTKNQQAARQLFSRYASLLKNNNPKVMELYAENATIYLSRNEANPNDLESLTKPEYREILAFFLAAAKKKGDRLEPISVSYQLSGNRVQISTTWYSRTSNTGFSQVLVVGPNNKGRWMIFEEYL